MLLELQTDTLQDVIAQNDKVIVQFSAGWCGNCRIMKPKFKRMSGEHDGMTFVIIDAEKNPESRKLGQRVQSAHFCGISRTALVCSIRPKPTKLKY